MSKKQTLILSGYLKIIAFHYSLYQPSKYIFKHDIGTVKDNLQSNCAETVNNVVTLLIETRAGDQINKVKLKSGLQI